LPLHVCCDRRRIRSILLDRPLGLTHILFSVHLCHQRSSSNRILLDPTHLLVSVHLCHYHQRSGSSSILVDPCLLFFSDHLCHQHSSGGCIGPHLVFSDHQCHQCRRSSCILLHLMTDCLASFYLCQHGCLSTIFLHSPRTLLSLHFR
jgi:hypothetical protein